MDAVHAFLRLDVRVKDHRAGGDAECRPGPDCVERADAFGQEDRVPVGQGGVGQVAGWASAAPVEGDIGGDPTGGGGGGGGGARAPSW